MLTQAKLIKLKQKWVITFTRKSSLESSLFQSLYCSFLQLRSRLTARYTTTTIALYHSPCYSKTTQEVCMFKHTTWTVSDWNAQKALSSHAFHPAMKRGQNVRQTCERSVVVGQWQGRRTRQTSDGRRAFFQTAHMHSAPSRRLDTSNMPPPTSIIYLSIIINHYK